MNRSLAKWRPAHMGRKAKPIMGVEPSTCYVFSGVGAAATSSFAIEAWGVETGSPVVPALVGWAPWAVLGAIVGITTGRPKVAYGIWLGSVVGSAIAVITNLILG